MMVQDLVMLSNSFILIELTDIMNNYKVASKYIKILLAMVTSIIVIAILWISSDFANISLPFFGGDAYWERRLSVNQPQMMITETDTNPDFIDILRGDEEAMEKGENFVVGTKVFPSVGAFYSKELRGQQLQSSCGLDDLSYHNGPLITAGANIYTYWIGSSASDYDGSSSTANLLTQLISNIGGSQYFNAVSSYKNSAGTNVRNAVSYKGKYNFVSHSNTLNDSFVRSTFIYSMNYLGVPVDPNGIYVIFFKGSLAYDSFTGAGIYGPNWCGYHSAINFWRNNVKTVLKFIVVGDPTYSPSGSSSNMNYCAYLKSGSVNGNAAADAMASVVSHELAETMTDPQFNGWYDSSGCEAGDRCAWYFGTNLNYNTNFGGRKWLLQHLWARDPQTQSRCTLCYGGTC